MTDSGTMLGVVVSADLLVVILYAVLSTAASSMIASSEGRGLLDTAGARAAVSFAAWAADAGAGGDGLLPEAAAMAKAAASEAGREVTAAAIQLHGGIGFTWEADVHWLFKRAQLDAVLLGGASKQRARLARIAGARAAA